MALVTKPQEVGPAVEFDFLITCPDRRASAHACGGCEYVAEPTQGVAAAAALNLRVHAKVPGLPGYTKVGCYLRKVLLLWEE